MDVQTISRILEVSQIPESSEYKLVLRQHFAGSSFAILITMHVSKEIALRLTAAAHLNVPTELTGHDVYCLIESKDTLIVKFELGGCFPNEATTYSSARAAIIAGSTVQKAPGLASLYLIDTVNGQFYEYFLCKKYFDDLIKAFPQDVESIPNGLDLTIDEMGRCYFKVRLTAKNITTETIFTKDSVASPTETYTTPSVEEFFFGK